MTTKPAAVQRFECLTCPPILSEYNGPCLGCGAFGGPHDAMRHHIAIGHDVRPVNPETAPARREEE